MAEPGDNRPPDALPLMDSPVGPTVGPHGAALAGGPGPPVPATRSDGGRWVLWALAGFIAGQLAALVLVALAAVVAGQSGQLAQIAKLSEPPEWYIGVSLVGVWLGFFAGPWLASRTRGTGHFLADLGVRFRLVDLLGVLFGVGAQFAISGVYTLFTTNPTRLGAPTQKLTGASHGGGFLVIALMTVVGAPFFEELFFRGLLLRGLTRLFAGDLGPSGRRTLALAAAIAADGLLFGLAHGEWFQFAGLAAFGALLALLAWRTGRLGMNMIAHASFNLVAVVAVATSRGGLVH